MSTHGQPSSRGIEKKQPLLSPSPLFPSKAKSWSPGAHILPEVEERGSDPAQGFGNPPLLIGFRGTSRRGDGQGIECGTQQGLPRQPVHLHWKTDPRKQGNQNQGPSGAGGREKSKQRLCLVSAVTHVSSLPQNHRTGQVPKQVGPLPGGPAMRCTPGSPERCLWDS